MSEEATLDKLTNDNESFELPFESSSVKSSLDETSAGKVPDEWNPVRLRELTENTLYGANESAEDYDPKKPRYIRIKDIDEHGRLKKEEKASLSPEKAEGYYLEGGDMLFARSGSPGRTYLHRKKEGKYCYGGYSIKHQLIADGLNHEYLSQYTKSSKYWDWIARIARTGAQANINSKEYASLLIPLPPLPEQRKIASVLYTVDRAIQKTEALIKQMHRVQRGLLRHLFGKGENPSDSISNARTERLGPKKFRIPTSWELTKITSIGEVVTGNTPSTDNEDNYGGDLPFVTPENLSRGKFVATSERTISEAGINEAKPIPKNSVMMDCIGSDMGKVAIADCEVATNQQINSVVIEDSDYLAEFLYYHFQVMSDFIKSRAGQTATPIVNKSSFESFAILKPPIEDQHRIVESVSVYDRGREVNQEYLSGLKRLKLGLMQDLLSGTVRTADASIEVPDEVEQHG